MHEIKKRQKNCALMYYKQKPINRYQCLIWNNILWADTALRTEIIIRIQEFNNVLYTNEEDLYKFQGLSVPYF